MTELTNLENLDLKREEFRKLENMLLNEKESLSLFLAELLKKVFSGINYIISIDMMMDESEESSAAVKTACKEFYHELHSENYEHSWANTAFAREMLPEKLSSLLSAIYYEAFQLPHLFRTGRMQEYENFLGLVNDLISKRKELGLNADSPQVFEVFLEIYRKYKIETLPYSTESDILKIFGVEDAPYEKVFAGKKPISETFLYNYGLEVDSLDLEYFNYVVAQEAALGEQADIFVKSFKEGLVRNATKCGTRNTIRIEYTMGQEPFLMATKQKLEKEGYVGYVTFINRIPENRQAAFDHKFDDALLFDESYKNLLIEHIAAAMEKHKEKLYSYLGIMFVESFGEAPYSFVSKETNLKMSPAQNELKQALASERMNLREKYLPSEETSFCIIGLPTSHAGAKLPEIFEATCRINAMANEDYEPVQQLVVDAADQGEYIIIKGCGLNETDMRIALPKIIDPSKQSNFVNCVAEVNIPIGEIFTSPQLSGTNGLLHLPDIYLDGFQYFNLRLTFTDGMISDFSCTNFDSAEENRAFVMENLLYPYESLPIGEFAIGTNTLAYVLSQKLDITRILPVLIVEKMGPHFAIGDTCFSHVEDVPFFNFLDGKEVIARDNEFCQKRKTDSKAGYTSVHTDITIPYDEIGLIAAVKSDGEMVKIIENGRFVLEGTDLLNKPFNEE